MCAWVDNAYTDKYTNYVVFFHIISPGGNYALQIEVNLRRTSVAMSVNTEYLIAYHEYMFLPVYNIHKL